MASLHGSGGSVTVSTDYADLLAGTDIDFFEWHATFDGSLTDDSNFSDATNFRTYLGTMHDLKGTAVGRMIRLTSLSNANPVLYDAATQNASAPTADFTLTTESGSTYTFDGIISSVKTTVIKTGVVGVIVTFESSGDITVT